MLLVGLLITMGIGSSFSTVPIIATIYVPLCIHLGFSPMATIALVGTAGALGTRVPRLRLDARPHIGPQCRRSARPHLGQRGANLHPLQHPLVIFGWIAAMVL